MFGFLQRIGKSLMFPIAYLVLTEANAPSAVTPVVFTNLDGQELSAY